MHVELALKVTKGGLRKPMSDLHIENAKIKDIEEFLGCRDFYARSNPREELSYYQGAIDALITAGFSIKKDENNKHTVKEVY